MAYSLDLVGTVVNYSLDGVVYKTFPQHQLVFEYTPTNTKLRLWVRDEMEGTGMIYDGLISAIDINGATDPDTAGKLANLEAMYVSGGTGGGGGGDATAVNQGTMITRLTEIRDKINLNAPETIAETDVVTSSDYTIPAGSTSYSITNLTGTADITINGITYSPSLSLRGKTATAVPVEGKLRTYPAQAVVTNGQTVYISFEV